MMMILIEQEISIGVSGTIVRALLEITALGLYLVTKQHSLDIVDTLCAKSYQMLLEDCT